MAQDLGIQSDYALLSDAIAEYTECLRREPLYPGALNNLGNALKELDRFRPALRASVPISSDSNRENCYADTVQAVMIAGM